MISSVEGHDSVGDPFTVFAGCSIPIAAYQPGPYTVTARNCMDDYGAMFLAPGAIAVIHFKLQSASFRGIFQHDVKAGIWQEVASLNVEIQMKRFSKRSLFRYERLSEPLPLDLQKTLSVQSYFAVVSAGLNEADLFLSFDPPELALATWFGLKTGPA